MTSLSNVSHGSPSRGRRIQALALSVAAFSDVLQSFDGGPGQIAIHGTNRPDLIGKFVSNGCIRLNNDDITALQPLVPVGTPVQIVA